MRSFTRLFLLICVMVNTAQALPCFVASTNHGGGWFSYTFSRGDDPYVWGLRSTGGFIQMQSYGVLEVLDSPGWTHTISSSGLIVWTVTNGIVFLDVPPVTFSIRSCLTESATYTQFGLGAIVGSVWELPGRTHSLGGGLQNFAFVGPALPSLNVERTGTNVTVQWSAQAQGLHLEACEQLDILASWTSVTNVPTIVNSNYTVEMPAAGLQKFFRLVSPCSN